MEPLVRRVILVFKVCKDRKARQVILDHRVCRGCRGYRVLRVGPVGRVLLDPQVSEALGIQDGRVLLEPQVSEALGIRVLQVGLD